MLLNKNCSYTSCRTARQESPNTMDLDTFLTARCYCDPDCKKFQDCCFDKSNTSYDTYTYDQTSLRWGCSHIPSQAKDVYMINSCPLHHTQFSNLCSGTVPNAEPYDYKQDIPVLSHHTGLWYQNFYCALCHEQQDNLVPVTLNFECTSNLTSDQVLQNGSYQPHELSWTLGQDKCKLKVGADFSNLTMENIEMRRCLPHISTCAYDWTHKTVEKLCYSYTHFVYGRVNGARQVYKNPHCALCNHARMKSLHCWSDDGVTGRPKAELSLITLLNLYWTIGDKNCRPPTHIYDPLHETCQPIAESCPENTVYNKGVCVGKHSNGTNATLGGTYLKTSCPVISLKSQEFTILNNSIQLALKTSHQVIPEGQYELTASGEAKVCYSAITSFPHVQDSLVSIICLSLSVICLALHNVIYCLLPKLQNLPARNLFSMSLSLFFAQLIFLTGLIPVLTVSPAVCVAIAVSIQYFFLSSFFWMNVLSFDVWKTFGGKTLSYGSRGNHWKYAIYAWGTPVLTICLSLFFEYVDIIPLQLRPNYAQLMTCWFGSQEGLLIFFVTPMFAVILMNVAFFGSTVYKLIKNDESRHFATNTNQRGSLTSGEKYKFRMTQRKSSCKTVQISHVTGKRDKIQFYLYLKLFVIMGLTWLSGIAAILFDLDFLRYIFVVFNGLQGVFIFLMFDFKCKIGGMLCGTLFSRCVTQSENSTKSNSTYRSNINSVDAKHSCL